MARARLDKQIPIDSLMNSQACAQVGSASKRLIVAVDLVVVVAEAVVVVVVAPASQQRDQSRDTHQTNSARLDG